MNDPEEGQRFLVLLQKDNGLRLLRDAISDYFEDDYKNCAPVFILCFTTPDDDLTLWRLYGQDGQGASIRLSGQALRECLEDPGNNSQTCVEIRYNDDAAIDSILQIAGPLLKLNEALDDARKNKAPDHTRHKEAIMTNARNWINVLRLCYKNMSYQAEKELRIIVTSNPHNQSRIIHDPDGKKVVMDKIVRVFRKKPNVFGTIMLGPCVDDREIYRLSLQRRLRTHHLTGWSVDVSKSKYRGEES